MGLRGPDAERLHAELEAAAAKERAEALARARADAERRGKERFDFEELRRLCDVAPDPERLEYMYYVEHPSLVTLADFARLVDELSVW